MKKLINLFTVLIISIVPFLSPLLQSNAYATVGDPTQSTITFVNGATFLVPNAISFDDHDQLANGDTVDYISTEGQHTISFGMTFEKELEGYTFTSATVNGAATALAGPTAGRYSVSVPETANYQINLTAERTGSQKHTIIWANPDVKDVIIDPDMLINNGYARVIAVYDTNGHLVPEEEYNINPGASGGLIDGFGHIEVEAGMRVVFEFTPIYGYQLVSVTANEMALAPQETTNQYTFIMPDTNVHFAANFARTDDAVVAESTNVSGGTVSLGANVLNAGTAKLTVNDTNLDAAKMADFNNAASGYAISNVIDIDFYNVFFKGKNDDSDVWSNQIHELNGEATITLRLADNVDVSRVVIVHNINDGADFEIIPIDSYDVEAHTITFRTRSFSNFAIATSAGAPDSGFATNPGATATSTISLTFSTATIITASAWFAYRLAKK